jgi:hypothetical protein
VPDPTKERGARSKANLNGNRGINSPGRPKSTPADKEVKRISKKLLLNPTYQRNLRLRLKDGKIQPGVEVMLWYYAFGKPTEIIETKQIVPVRLVHEYATAEKA